MTIVKQILFLIFLLCFSVNAYAGECRLYFDEKSGLFKIKSNSVDLVSSIYVFWGKDWGWANTRPETRTIAPKTYEIDAKVEKLDINISAIAKVSEPNQLNWKYSYRANKTAADAIGGGIAFSINPGDNANVDIALLPDNSGWVMDGHHGCENVTVRFSKPLKKIEFAGNNKNNIRAYFYSDHIENEAFENEMSVTLPYDADYIGTTSEQLGGTNKLLWRKDFLHPNYSPVDLSFMNAPEIPAGKRGFLKAKDDKLVFEDGTEARFWGTNIQAYTLFQTSPSQIKTHAKRLSKLGFNLVRFHHHDSGWVAPNIFGNRASGTRTFDKESLKRLDMWIKAFKDEGIYVWLDLNVGREFTEQDGIENFAEMAKNRRITPAKGFSYIDDDVERLFKEFNETYLNHINEYTGLAYKDDPAIINVLITNENDLTHHYGNALLPDKNVPVANKKYMEMAEQFANKNGLSKDQTWRSWEFGPSKIFLNDLEHNYNQRMINHLRTTGLKANISTTNSWGRMPISSLPALTDSTIVDAHSYGKPDFFKVNPRYKDNFIHWIGAAHVNGKPLSVSEWNMEPFPDTFDRFSSPVYMATTAAFQGWDAMMQYGYAQQPLNNEGGPSNYTTFNDPASMALMPAAALIYRQKHVNEAEKTYALSMDKDIFYGQSNDPSNSATVRTLMEQSKLIIDIPETDELPWLKPTMKPEDAIIITNPDQDFIPDGNDFITSDTGEITRNWKDGIYTINSDKSQVAMGWIGGQDIKLDNIALNFTNNNAAVAVQTLDSKPILESDNILISFATVTVPSEGNKMPFISEPLNGSLSISAKPNLNLYMMNKYGKEINMPVDYEDGVYHIMVDRNIKSFWLSLKTEQNE